jgi:hypothetical protein
MILRSVLYAVAVLLLGAHFLRAGSVLLVALCLATPLLFLWRKGVSLILLQIAAYVAAATWLEAAFRLVELRQRIGQPWTLAAVILGAVALFTLASGLLLNSRSIKERYPTRDYPSSRDS